MKFTYQEYSALLDRILDEGYETEFFTGSVDNRTVLLRHDIDFSPQKSLRLADIEERHGVRGTYFFLLTSPLYNALNREIRTIITELIKRGHRVGLHFDTHQYWNSEKPDDESLERKVRSELNIISEITGSTVDVVSFHNPPDWVFERSYDEFVSAYESKYFETVEYIADSNQRWRGEDPFDPSSNEPLQILTHPILWGEQDGTKNEFLRQEREDIIENIDKHIDNGMI